MAGNCGSFAGGTIDIDTVTTAFAEELNTVAFEVSDQIDPFMKWRQGVRG